MKRMIRTVCLLILLLSAVFVQAACSGRQPSASVADAALTEAQRDIYAMDTYMTVTCYGERAEEAVSSAETEIRRLDELLSVGNPESEIGRVNAEGEGTLTEDTRILVEQSLHLYDMTHGAFDITIYPLMELWGFTSGDYQVPEAEQLQSTLAAVGSDQLTYDNGTLKLGPGQGIDLGGIAKGYTSDRLMQIFASCDLEAGMVSLGGNVQLYKRKPDGSLWKCGIRDPHAASGSELLGVLQAEDCAVITSGAYERNFTDDTGHFYHHIINPETGYPAESGLLSVSIVSTDGIFADALSTACYVLGLEDSIELWKTSDRDFDMILMTDADEICITEGIADRFQSDYPVRIISKEY